MLWGMIREAVFTANDATFRLLTASYYRSDYNQMFVGCKINFLKQGLKANGV